MSAVEQFLDPYVGQKVANGQCGGLSSFWLEHLTGGKWQFGGSDQGEIIPPFDGSTAGGAFDGCDWESIGFEKIANPTFAQLQVGDIFFISTDKVYPTGHTGIVANVDNNNVTTYEQNVLSAEYVQKLPDQNSWSWYNGFMGVVRPKATVTAPTTPTQQAATVAPKTETEENTMFFIQTVDTKAIYQINAGMYSHIANPGMWANFQKAFPTAPVIPLFQAEMEALYRPNVAK